MFNATVWNDDLRTTRTVHKDVGLTRTGVVVKDENGNDLLIPFGSGRVYTVSSDIPGAIEIELGQ